MQREFNILKKSRQLTLKPEFDVRKGIFFNEKSRIFSILKC